MLLSVIKYKNYWLIIICSINLIFSSVDPLVMEFCSQLIDFVTYVLRGHWLLAYWIPMTHWYPILQKFQRNPSRIFMLIIDLAIWSLSYHFIYRTLLPQGSFLHLNFLIIGFGQPNLICAGSWLGQLSNTKALCHAHLYRMILLYF